MIESSSLLSLITCQYQKININEDNKDLQDSLILTLNTQMIDENHKNEKPNFSDVSQQSILQFKSNEYSQSMMTPQIYQSLRLQQLINSINIQQEGVKIDIYSKGRLQIYFPQRKQTILQSSVLIQWKNGDFKLIWNENVYFWHEDMKFLDQYYNK